MDLLDDGPLIVRGVGEVAAVVPHMLGVNPRDSLVVFPTRTGTLPVARIDLPGTPGELEAAAEGIAHAYAGRGGEVMLLAYTDRLELAQNTCEAMRARLEPGTGVVAAAAIQQDRWVRLDRRDSGCVGQGTHDRFAAEYAVRGRRAPYSSQDELRDSFQPGRALPAEAMRRASAAARASVGSDEAAATERAWMTLTLQRFTATGARPNEADAARMVSDVQHIGLRDHAWASMDAQNAASHAAFWKDLLVRSPEGTRAPTASLTAFAHWLGGDGIGARMALERVPDDPPYSMAKLVTMALTVGMDPKGWSLPPELRAEPVENAIVIGKPTTARARLEPPRLGPDRDTPSPGR